VNTRFVSAGILISVVAAALVFAAPVGASVGTHWASNSSQVDDRCGTADEVFQIKVFENANQTGAKFKICGPLDVLWPYQRYFDNALLDWNDTISYLRVASISNNKCVLTYSEGNDQGGHLVWYNGQEGTMPANWNDRISSIDFAYPSNCI
jgi:hypothetical protein